MRVFLGKDIRRSLARGLQLIVMSGVLFLIFASLFGGLSIFGAYGIAVVLFVIGLYILFRPMLYQPELQESSRKLESLTSFPESKLSEPKEKNGFISLLLGFMSVYGILGCISSILPIAILGVLIWVIVSLLR